MQAVSPVHDPHRLHKAAPPTSDAQEDSGYVALHPEYPVRGAVTLKVLKPGGHCRKELSAAASHTCLRIMTLGGLTYSTPAVKDGM